MAQVRQLLPILGTLMTVFGVSSATAQATVNMLMSIAGPITLIGSALWSYYSNSKASILTSAANMTEVKAVKLEDNAPSDLVANTPSNVTK